MNEINVIAAKIADESSLTIDDFHALRSIFLKNKLELKSEILPRIQAAKKNEPAFARRIILNKENSLILKTLGLIVS